MAGYSKDQYTFNAKWHLDLRFKDLPNGFRMDRRVLSPCRRAARGSTEDHGDIIYAAYGFARFIGKIDVTNGSISSIAGQPYKREWCPVYTTGESSKAEFVSPETIITNKKGEIIFTDERLHRVIRIANGQVLTPAANNIIDPCSQNIGGRAQEGYKDGKTLAALFNFPKGIAYDSKGNLVHRRHE